jgi:hypothetical protein
MLQGRRWQLRRSLNALGDGEHRLSIADTERRGQKLLPAGRQHLHDVEDNVSSLIVIRFQKEPLLRRPLLNIIPASQLYLRFWAT